MSFGENIFVSRPGIAHVVAKRAAPRGVGSFKETRRPHACGRPPGRPVVTLRNGLLAIVAMASASLPVVAHGAPTQVESAIEFLKQACVTGGSSVDVRATGDGSLQIVQGGVSGPVTGAVLVQRKQLDGLADAASEFAAQQANEMRACMKPYIDKIITTMLAGASSGPKVVSIQTDGGYFVTSEFDAVMASAAEKPTGSVSVGDVSRLTKLHPAKVTLYFNVADRNSLGYTVSGGNFYIAAKGIEYVLARDLVK